MRGCRLKYLNTFRLSDVEWSRTRLWMALIMVAAMAIVMLGFMWSMYASRRRNIAIVAGSVAVLIAALTLVRTQATVGDVSYMREIAEMRRLIDELQRDPARQQGPLLPAPEVSATP